MVQGVSMIHLREPPRVLRPSETHSDQETIEIAVTKMLLRFTVPKESHNVFIKKLHRDNLFEEILQEPDEVAMKRKHTRETLRVLQQAFRVSARFILVGIPGYVFSTDFVAYLCAKPLKGNVVLFRSMNLRVK